MDSPRADQLGMNVPQSPLKNAQTLESWSGRQMSAIRTLSSKKRPADAECTSGQHGLASDRIGAGDLAVSGLFAECDVFAVGLPGHGTLLADASATIP